MKYKVYLIFICIFMFLSTVVNAKDKTLNVDAREAIAIDGTSGVILYEKNANIPVPMASTTKIITSLVALNRGNLEDKVTISKSAVSIRGSKVGYRVGEEVTLRELLYGLMYKSGNDAALAIAEHIGGTLDNFYYYMNECSKNIGLINSSFNSPHGLDTENHYSSAYDLAIATKKAMENETFREIVGTKDIKKEKYNFTRDYNNINKILFQIPDANGVKTGYTGGAGKCLVSSVRLNDRDIIMVVLNSPNRWNETSKLFDYVKEKNEIFEKEYKDLISNKNLSDYIINDKISIEVPKEGIEYKVCYISPINNILKGDYIGFIKIINKNNGKEIYRKNIFSNRNINKEFFNRMVKSE